MADNPYDSPQVTAESSVVGSGDFKDRSLGLILFGCLQILLGALCGSMALLMLSSIAMMQQTGQSVDTILPAVAMYSILAIGGITLGIGSIRCRRWARAITLIGSWMWLLMGLVTMVFLLVFMPQMMERMTGQENLPEGAKLFIMIFTGGFIGCLYVILPAAFVAFYQSSGVKATCEFKNTNECWTDRSPLPVLAMSIALGFGAFSAFMTLRTSVFPFFGSFVSGPPAAMIMVTISVILAVLARGTYRLQISAWWATLILITLWSTSALVTFARVGLMGMYEQMNIPEDQLDLMRQMGFSEFPMTTATVISAALLVGYIVFVRRYFVAAAKRNQQAASP